MIALLIVILLFISFCLRRKKKVSPTRTTYLNYPYEPLSSASLPRLAWLRARGMEIARRTGDDRALRALQTMVLRERRAGNGALATTHNKGERISICVRAATGELHTPEQTLYVFLHELAHVSSLSVGHTREFHDRFEQLSNAADQLGYRQPELPHMYCGRRIFDY